MSDLRDKNIQNRIFFLKMEVGTALEIVCGQRSNSLLRNGGIALSYVDLESPAIKICADGWRETIRLRGYDSPTKYFSLIKGIEDVSFAIAHESVHQVLVKLEGKTASLNLDRISGGGELA
jgi:hypothetical protein